MDLSWLAPIGLGTVVGAAVSSVINARANRRLEHYRATQAHMAEFRKALLAHYSDIFAAVYDLRDALWFYDSKSDEARVEAFNEPAHEEEIFVSAHASEEAKTNAAMARLATTAAKARYLVGEKFFDAARDVLVSAQTCADEIKEKRWSLQEFREEISDFATMDFETAMDHLHKLAVPAESVLAVPPPPQDALDRLWDATAPDRDTR